MVIIFTEKFLNVQLYDKIYEYDESWPYRRKWGVESKGENIIRYYGLRPLIEMIKAIDFEMFEAKNHNSSFWLRGVYNHDKRMSYSYAHKTPEGFFNDFHSHKLGVEVYGGNNIIVKVKIEEDSDGFYWAWWDTHDDNRPFKFYHIYKNEGMVRMCFPYRLDLYEKYGEGKLLKVNVTEVVEVQEDAKLN